MIISTKTTVDEEKGKTMDEGEDCPNEQTKLSDFKHESKPTNNPLKHLMKDLTIFKNPYYYLILLVEIVFFFCFLSFMIIMQNLPVDHGIEKTKAASLSSFFAIGMCVWDVDLLISLEMMFNHFLFNRCELNSHSFLGEFFGSLAPGLLSFYHIVSNKNIYVFSMIIMGAQYIAIPITCSTYLDFIISCKFNCFMLNIKMLIKHLFEIQNHYISFNHRHIDRRYVWMSINTANCKLINSRFQFWKQIFINLSIKFVLSFYKVILNDYLGTFSIDLLHS